MCETCSFGAPLLVFVLCPGYGEMPLYCSKVCARPLQHSIILGSCDSTKVMLALFCTVVFSRSCENCNGVEHCPCLTCHDFSMPIPMLFSIQCVSFARAARMQADFMNRVGKRRA